MRFSASIIMAIILFFAGWFSKSYLTSPEIIVEQKEKIVYKTIERDVYKMPDAELRKELEIYYTEKPRLDIIQINNTLIRADAGLGDREWSREAKIKVRSSGNWNYYIAGLACAAAITSGILLKK